MRDELGPDALILSTRVVPAPGPRGWMGRRLVEVTAAPGGSEVPEVRPAAAAAPSQAPGDRTSQALAARLRAAGLDTDLAEAVAGAHPPRSRRGASVQSVCAALAGQLESLVADDEGYAPVEVFIGPPGVGKTTTIAKIAAQERTKRGNRLGLVAADGFRVGAVEQLRLYARVLGAPLAVARTPYELMTVLETSSGPVLVDTAGRSPSDEASRDMLRVIGSRPGVRTHLVVAADTPPVSIRRVLDRFEPARPSRLVLTKLDEAESLAPIVSVLRERKIPLSYLGTGQRVPDDLQEATPRALASWIAGETPASGAVA